MKEEEEEEKEKVDAEKKNLMSSVLPPFIGSVASKKLDRSDAEMRSQLPY